MQKGNRVTHMVHIINCLVTDKDRQKALIKYELNYLKCRLRWHLQHASKSKYYSAEVILLCASLTNKYSDYLRLFDEQIIPLEHKSTVTVLDWTECFKQISDLEMKLAQAVMLDEVVLLLVEIISYYKLIKRAAALAPVKRVNEHALQLRELFQEPQPHLWLERLVTFGNSHDVSRIELAVLFRDFTLKLQQAALSFFSDPEFVNLVNALFFYKFHPDKLFDIPLHPEKLISVRVRLGVLHCRIELMQQQLYDTVLQNGLMSGVDYYLHGNELPPGVSIEIDGHHKVMIQSAIKKIKLTLSSANEQRQSIEYLKELKEAYKFWFNPTHLIDTLMVLHQKCVSASISNESSVTIFQQHLAILYTQLTTTECLDLYGYFSNNDTRYLLYTFSAITQGMSFEWLPPISIEEQTAIETVFQTLDCLMETLRLVLRKRHIITAPYAYDMKKQEVHIGHRNRDAVLRVITIYGGRCINANDKLEELFSALEAVE